MKVFDGVLQKGHFLKFFYGKKYVSEVKGSFLRLQYKETSQASMERIPFKHSYN